MAYIRTPNSANFFIPKITTNAFIRNDSLDWDEDQLNNKRPQLLIGSHNRP